MKLEFASHRLADAGVSLSDAVRQFGVPIGQKYIQRLAVLRAADKFVQLYGHRALRSHSLKRSRRGQYTVALIGNHRLIIEPAEEDRVRIVDVED